MADLARSADLLAPLNWRLPLATLIAGKVFAAGFLLAGLLFNFLPAQSWNYLVYSDATAGWLLPFVNWDGQHYLRLALTGYPVPADPSTAFFPLFPGLIALAMTAGFPPIIAGLVVVTAASAAALLFLERLLPAERAQPSSLWLVASFPTAFYLSVIYSESVFIALLLALLWSLRDAGRSRYAFGFAAALPLCRGEGLWLAAPIAVTAAAFAIRGGGGSVTRRSLAAAALGYALGVTSYFAFYWSHYGDPMAGIAAQSLFVFKNAASNLFDIPRFLQFMVTPPHAFFAYSNSGLDKVMIVLSLVALALGARRASAEPFLLSLWACFAVLPAVMGEGGSYARHALLAWICFGIAVGPSLSTGLKTVLIACGLAFQAYFAYRFGGNYWVG